MTNNTLAEALQLVLDRNGDLSGRDLAVVKKALAAHRNAPADELVERLKGLRAKLLEVMKQSCVRDDNWQAIAKKEVEIYNEAISRLSQPKPSGWCYDMEKAPKDKDVLLKLAITSDDIGGPYSKLSTWQPENSFMDAHWAGVDEYVERPYAWKVEETLPPQPPQEN